MVVGLLTVAHTTEGMSSRRRRFVDKEKLLVYSTDILTSTKDLCFFIHAEWCTPLTFIVKVLFAAIQPWLFLSRVFLSADLLSWLLLCRSRYRSSAGESPKPEERVHEPQSWEAGNHATLLWFLTYMLSIVTCIGICHLFQLQIISSNLNFVSICFMCRYSHHFAEISKWCRGA